MVRHVLVPLDGSDPAWNALAHASERYEGERITVLHVADPVDYSSLSEEGGYYGYYDTDALDRAVEQGEELCEQARKRLQREGVLDTTSLETAVEIGNPPKTIVEYASEHDVDHIVMGSHGRSGLSRLLLGSVAETVVRRAPVVVTVVRDENQLRENQS